MSIVSALVNLLNNALEAMAGHGILTIVTECRADVSKVRIRIHNSGPPLSAEELERISHPGQSSKGEDHLGLGLAMARQAVAEAGGTLDMHSPEQGGVEAVVSLPIWRDPAAGHTRV